MKKLLKRFYNNFLDIFDPQYVFVVRDLNNKKHYFYGWNEYQKATFFTNGIRTIYTNVTPEQISRNDLPTKEELLVKDILK